MCAFSLEIKKNKKKKRMTSELKKIWHLHQQNEQLAIQVLNWTELQVAQASHQQIADALIAHKKEISLKKQQLPVITAPEIIVILSCLQFKNVSQSPPKNLTPHKTPYTTPHATPHVQTPHVQTPHVQTPHVTPHVKLIIEEESVGKTPGFVRESAKPTLTEQSCRELVDQLKQLQKRRGGHDILLANPHLNESDTQEIEKSCMRTNSYIKECLQRMWVQKEQIATALQSKKTLAMCTDAFKEPEVLALLTGDVAKLISLQTILNEGLEPA